jgi:hypothetical protein
MAVVRVRNVLGPLQVRPPTRPDGALYRFELIYDGGRWRGYADTTDELVDAMIPGYSDLDPARQSEARLTYAVRAQVMLQAELNVDIGLDGCREEEKDLLRGDRSVPPAPDVWTAPVPLVLVASFYAPAGDLVAPLGAGGPPNLVWLDPTSADALLRSLSRAGVVQLSQADEGAGTGGGAGR